MTPSDVKLLRISLRLDQKQFATKVGVAHKTISDWERSKKGIAQSRIEVMKKFYTPESLISKIMQSACQEEITDLEKEAKDIKQLITGMRKRTWNLTAMLNSKP